MPPEPPRRLAEPREERPERTAETAKAANPNHRKAVLACASVQRLLRLSLPFVTPFLLV